MPSPLANIDIDATPRPAAGLLGRIANHIRPIPVLPGRLMAPDLSYVSHGEFRRVLRPYADPSLVVKVAPGQHPRGSPVFRREFRAVWNAPMPEAPLPQLYGMIDTELGPAQVCEAILDPDGNIAPPLSQLVHPHGAPPEILDALNTFIATMYALHIPATDFNISNIVYGEGRSRRGVRFYMIDGFGDRRRFPEKTLIKHRNDASLDEHLLRIGGQCPLVWDARLRRYRNP